MASGRKHMTHMTALDKNLLTALIEEKKDILNLKTKDIATNDRKKTAWAEIAAKFNSSYCISATRTPDQLCKAWENMLAKARRESLGVARKPNSRYHTRAAGAAFSRMDQHQAEEVIIALDPRGHIDLSSEGQEEPKPNGCRKNAVSQSAEMMIMRHEQHEAKMEKLHWETLYWRTKYEREFGQLSHQNGFHKPMDNCSN